MFGNSLNRDVSCNFRESFIYQLGVKIFMVKKSAKKEKVLFFGGIIIGICGGLVGNILVTSMDRFIDSDYSKGNLYTLLFSILIFWGLSYWLYRQIKA